MAVEGQAGLGPLVLAPVFKQRIWGAEALPAPYPQPAAGERIGEVWLTAEECKVSGGSCAGQTLGTLAAQYTKAMGAADGAGFPLLLKVLLPREKLSVQVHPNDAQARVLGEARGKTECWYVLDAEPGAEVAVGLSEGAKVAHVRAAIADGSMESLMRMLPVKAGDMVFVDAGTVHAIGPGMTVLETQQYSDITYRMFDYGRPRELHVEQGLAVTRTQTEAGLVKPRALEGFTRLVECAYFAVDRFEAGAGEHRLNEADKLQVLFALGPGCSVAAGGVETALPQGQAVVLPAEGVAYTLHNGTAAVVRVVQP